uniref:Uncharacterized protein n=1 Tax=viral metagenome TaxID=1070528 RepID=A0A6M3JTY3_9ZZZZ
MKIKLERNGRIWRNGQSGGIEEVLDIYYGENMSLLHARGFCNRVWPEISGYEIKMGEAIVVEFEIVKSIIIEKRIDEGPIASHLLQ